MKRNHKKVLKEIFEDDERKAAEQVISGYVANNLKKFLIAADAEFRVSFFKNLEVLMPASAAKKVALHPLRADEVSELVAEMKAEIEAAKEARKAEREAARKRKNGSAE